MAIKLESKTNVNAPNATYPYGQIKNDSGANDGTPVNEQTYGDFHQFFARMLALSGITPNDLPENATNGFQYMEAFLKHIHLEINKTTLYPNPASVPFTTLGSGKQAIELGAFRNYEFDLNTSTSEDVVTFGDSIPIGYSGLIHFSDTSGTFSITLNSTDAGSKPTIRKEGVGGANTPYTITLGKTIRVIRWTNYWEIIELS